jgi:hypothetical protein
VGEAMDLDLYRVNEERYKNILDKIKNRQAILFLGAGSTASCSCLRNGSDEKEKQKGVTGEQLADEILKKLNNNKKISELGKIDLMRTSELYVANNTNARQGLDELIQERLSKLQPTIGHYIATSFPWKAVVTTNFNKVIEDAWTEAHMLGFTYEKLVSIRSDHDKKNYKKKPGIKLYKPHGCISLSNQSKNQMILTTKDYFDSKKIRIKIYKKIKSLAKDHSTVFVGYSMQDYTFRNMYYKIKEELKSRTKESFSIGTMTKENNHPKYGQWIKRFMRDNFRMTLITDTFDTFMLRLLIENGTVNRGLKNKIIDNWDVIEKDNSDYLNGLKLENIEKLSEI